MKTLRFSSERVNQIPPYMFVEIDRKKAILRKNGVDVIDLGIGDPDLPTPQHILDKMHQEIDLLENSKYCGFIGDIVFREAVANYYREIYGVNLDPETEVMTLIGSKEGLANLIYAQIDPGDYTLVPDPCYPVYRIATLLANGTYHSMPLREENAFLPDYDEIPQLVRDRARLLFINYPNNPTAATAPKQFYEETIHFAREQKIVVAHDFAYNEICFDNYKPPSILQIPGAKDVAVELGSLSKTFNMTGWRIGYMVGNKNVIQAVAKIKSNVDTGQYRAIQRTGAYALTGPRDFLKHNIAIYEERLQVVLLGLQNVGIKVFSPKATFFVWAKVPTEETSAEFTERLLDQAGVAVTPGSAFGEYGEGYFRISLSVSAERLQQAMDRIKEMTK